MVAIAQACLNNKEDVLQDIHVVASTGVDIKPLLFSAVSNKFAGIVRWLLREFKVNRSDVDVRALLVKNADNGDLDTAQAIHQHFQMTMDDIRSKHGIINLPLRVACVKGFEDYAKWFAKSLNLTAIDFYSNQSPDRYALIRIICASGKLAMVQWLFESFSHEDVRSEVLEATNGCCEAGQLDVILYLDSRFMFTSDEVKQGYHNMQYNSIRSKNVGITQWVRDKIRAPPRTPPQIPSQT